MKADDVDAFFRVARRSLPASPDWRAGNRTGERRASLPVAANGIVGEVSLEITVRLPEPNYLMMLLLADRTPICRLCMTTGHWDRLTKKQIDQAHFHSWEANRGSAIPIPKKLNQLEIVPLDIMGRDKAFAWFLDRNGIESPAWAGSVWPTGQGML